MPNTEVKPEETASQGDKALPYGEALTEAVKQLKGHPPFLGAVAIGILLIAVAVLGPANARDIILILLAIYAIATVAWVVGKAGRIRQARGAGLVVRGGNVKVGPFARMGKNSKIGSGGIKISGVDAKHLKQVDGGDVKAGLGTNLDEGARLGSGRIDIDAGGKKGQAGRKPKE